MNFADEQSYEDMIQALQQFLAEAEEQCTVMERAGEDCVDNTEDDPIAKRANESLLKCVKDIRSNFSTINGIINALKQQLEDIRRTNTDARFDY